MHINAGAKSAWKAEEIISLAAASNITRLRRKVHSDARHKQGEDLAVVHHVVMATTATDTSGGLHPQVLVHVSCTSLVRLEHTQGLDKDLFFSDDRQNGFSRSVKVFGHT